MQEKTPSKRYSKINLQYITPPLQKTLSEELKQVLNERNLLTVKSRKKICRMLDALSPEQRHEIDKRKSLRLKAIEEILTSEKSYLQQLEKLMKYFIVPLKEKNIIDDHTHTTLFGHIGLIYNLNGELMNELEDNLENVGQSFLKLAPFFKLYSVYAFDYKNALLVLQDITNKNSIFKKFLEDTESRPEVQCKLYSLLIVPIQRVPRYRLLLKQVLLYTSSSDSDFKILQDSIKQVENTVSHIDSVIEDQENIQMLLNFQNSLVNRSPNIVKPGRKIVKEGILSKVTRNGTTLKRYCILMSDIFMYCKILKERNKNAATENSLQCCCIFPLKKCKISDMFPGTFKISCQGDGIIFCTDSTHVAQRWVSELREAIDLHIIYRKTLRKESSKRKPIRNKDIRNFGLDDIFSPSKSKVDYDNVFRCGNSSESDTEDTENQTLCFNIKSFSLLKHMYPRSQQSVIKHNKKSFTNSTFVSETIPLHNNITKTSELSTIMESPCDRHNNYQTPVASDSEHDPTYGFANRFSESKSYFRTQNVDALSEKKDWNRFESSPVQGTTGNSNYLDILYPLREISGGSSNRSLTSNLSNTSSRKRKPQYQFNDEDLIDPIYQSLNECPVNKKRVKFAEDRNYLNGVRTNLKFEETKKTAPFCFNNILKKNQGNRITLKQRIVDFFSNLFYH